MKEALERAVSTRAKVTSWGQINQLGTPSDKQMNGPKSARNQERSEVFNRKKRPPKENAKYKDRQEKRAQKMASLVSDSDSSDSPRKSDDSDGSSGLAARKLDGSSGLAAR